MFKKLCVTAAAAALAVTISGCSMTKWLGSKEPEPEPVPMADDIFKQGEDLLSKGKYEKARQAYSRIREHDPERSFEPLVQVRLGDSYYEEGRFAEAEVEYRRFFEQRPRNKAAPYVKYQIGMCNFKQIGTPDRDPQFAVAAARNFSELLRDYPNNPYVDEANEKLRISRGKVAEHEYVVGSYYYRVKSYPAAINRFKGILRDYPGSKDEPEVLYYLADSYVRLRDYDDAKKTLAVLYQEHPNHRMAEKAKDKLADKIADAEAEAAAGADQDDGAGTANTDKSEGADENAQ